MIKRTLRAGRMVEVADGQSFGTERSETDVVSPEMLSGATALP